MTAKDAKSRVLWNRIPESIKKAISKATKNGYLSTIIEIPNDSESYIIVNILGYFEYTVQTIVMDSKTIELNITWC